jgi:hypothetical protein
MATVNEIDAIMEIHEFLVGRYRETGHPFEQKEKYLQDALDILTMNIRSQIEAALHVLQTALTEDDGWLMLVMFDHTSDPDFTRIKEVCVELRDTFSLQTSDSFPDDAVRGDWQQMDVNSELFLEVYWYEDRGESCHLTSTLYGRPYGSGWWAQVTRCKHITRYMPKNSFRRSIKLSGTLSTLSKVQSGPCLWGRRWCAGCCCTTRKN